MFYSEWGTLSPLVSAVPRTTGGEEPLKCVLVFFYLKEAVGNREPCGQLHKFL